MNSNATILTRNCGLKTKRTTALNEHIRRYTTTEQFNALFR